MILRISDKRITIQCLKNDYVIFQWYIEVLDKSPTFPNVLVIID